MIFALPAATCFAVRLAALIGLHLVPSPYRPITHAVSDYAVGPTKRLAALASWVTTIGWFTLALAVWTRLGDWAYRPVATGMLIALGLLSITVVFVPTDLEGERRTLRGTLHYLVAIASFALAYSLTGNASRYATAAGWGLAPALDTLHWIALAGLIALCAALVIKPLRRVFGLCERVFLLAIVLFYVAFSLGIVLGA